jgi:hypothetical protein
VNHRSRVLVLLPVNILLLYSRPFTVSLQDISMKISTENYYATVVSIFTRVMVISSKILKYVVKNTRLFILYDKLIFRCVNNELLSVL